MTPLLIREGSKKKSLIMKSNSLISFKAKGRADFMGFKWYYAYDAQGNPILENGIHLAYKATDAAHASRMHDQITSIRKS